MEAGGLLAGSDINGGFVSLAVSEAKKSKNQTALRTWFKAGAAIDEGE